MVGNKLETRTHISLLKKKKIVAFLVQSEKKK